MLPRFGESFSEEYLQELSKEELIAHIREFERSREQRVENYRREKANKEEGKSFSMMVITSIMILGWFVFSVVADSNTSDFLGHGFL